MPVPVVPVGRGALPNPFDFIHEIRDMNNELGARLDAIIMRLDELILIERDRDVVWYGDGK